MKRPSRSMGGALMKGGRVVPSRETPYDVYIDGQWYTPASPIPSVTPTVTPSVTGSVTPSITPTPSITLTPSITPTPTPSLISENPIGYITVEVTGGGSYWGGPVNLSGRAYDGFDNPILLTGKTVVWSEEVGYEGTVNIQNQSQTDYVSTIDASPTGVATGSVMMQTVESGEIGGSFFVYQSTVIELTFGAVCSPLNPSSYYRRGDMILGTVLFSDYSCTTLAPAGTYVEESMPTNVKYTVDANGIITLVEDCV